MTGVVPPATGPRSGSSAVATEPVATSAMSAARSSTCTQAQVCAGFARRSPRRTARGRRVFQTDVSPAPMIAGGRTSTVVTADLRQSHVGGVLGIGVVPAAVGKEGTVLGHVIDAGRAVVDPGRGNVHEPGDAGVPGGPSEV